MQGSRIRAARKSEWLKCALAHHFNPDPGVENEIVVLATGVDQYLQEVFHHLAFYNCDNLVSDVDFRILCLVLGISINAETENGASEHEDICYALPRALNFKEFHARLCGFFSVKAQEGNNGARLPVSEETEHIEREIRLRHPRVRRRKCVSFDLSKDQNRKISERESGLSQNLDQSQNSVGDLRKTPVDINPQRRWKDQLELENASLRELVEDLRSALQSSDARCMALEVALRRKQVPPQNAAAERQDCNDRTKTQSRQSKPTERSTKDLLRELELIRASRDGQLEEAMRFNQRLEEELMGAYRELNKMQETVESVRRENARIKKRAEDARGALAAGLERVRALQDQAQHTDLLQEQVQSLEAQLEMFRTQCTCREVNMNQTEMLEECKSSSPASHNEIFTRKEESLQRSVEGRAASDEEEDEMCADEGQCCLLEVKRLINRLHGCAKGCQKAAICHWLVSQSQSREFKMKGKVCITGEDELGHESMRIQKKQTNALRLGDQMMKTESVRHSLLQLQHKRISRRALGKILLDTLDLCSRESHDCTPVSQVVDTLCQQLLSSDLLHEGEEVSIGSQPLTSGHRNTANPIVMSC